MTTYIVATNTDLTFMVKTKSKAAAVKMAKQICCEKGYDWYKELDFEAYEIEDWMANNEGFEIETKYVEPENESGKYLLFLCTDHFFFYDSDGETLFGKEYSDLGINVECDMTDTGRPIYRELTDSELETIDAYIRSKCGHDIEYRIEYDD